MLTNWIIINPISRIDSLNTLSLVVTCIAEGQSKAGWQTPIKNSENNFLGMFELFIIFFYSHTTVHKV